MWKLRLNEKKENRGWTTMHYASEASTTSWKAGCLLAVPYLRPWSFICGSIAVFGFTRAVRGRMRTARPPQCYGGWKVRAPVIAASPGKSADSNWRLKGQPNSNSRCCWSGSSAASNVSDRLKRQSSTRRQPHRLTSNGNRHRPR